MPAPTPSQPDTRTQDARQLLVAINTLTRIHDRELRRDIRRLRLPTSQALALESLCTHGALSLSELAAQIHLEISTASRMIDILEQKGLLSRSPDPQDARSLKLEATPEGREKFEQIEAKAIERMKLLLGNADPELRQATVRIVEWLAGNSQEVASTTSNHQLSCIIQAYFPRDRCADICMRIYPGRRAAVFRTLKFPGAIIILSTRYHMYVSPHKYIVGHTTQL